MDSALLHVFKAVVEEGGVGAAARRLHRVQSNVSTRLRQLEETLGVQLFVREGRRLRLSADGERFMEYADRMLATWDEALEAMQDDSPLGALRLGTMESAAASRLPGVLAEYHRCHPAVRVELVTATSDCLLSSVIPREVDAAFVADFDTATGLDGVAAFREELVVLTAADHPPIRRPRDVRADTLIPFPAGCAYRRRVQRWLAEDRVMPARVLELASYHAIAACAASGTGIALAPRSVLETIRHPELAVHTLPARIARSVTSLVWRHDRSTGALQALVRQLTRRRRAVPVEAA